jgi:hypothetical protein
MAIPDKKTPAIAVPDAADAPAPHPRRAEAAAPTSWDNPSEPDQNTKYPYPWSVDPDEGVVPNTPGPPDAATPLDANLAPNQFPRQSGSDTYSEIPGDGQVPG